MRERLEYISKMHENYHQLLQNFFVNLIKNICLKSNILNVQNFKSNNENTSVCNSRGWHENELAVFFCKWRFLCCILINANSE